MNPILNDIELQEMQQHYYLLAKEARTEAEKLRGQIESQTDDLDREILEDRIAAFAALAEAHEHEKLFYRQLQAMRQNRSPDVSGNNIEHAGEDEARRLPLDPHIDANRYADRNAAHISGGASQELAYVSRYRELKVLEDRTRLEREHLHQQRRYGHTL